MNDRKDRPVLDIPVSDGIDIEAVEVEFLFDTPKDIDKGNYTLYVYTVMHDGVEHVMFAYSGLYRALENIGVTSGTIAQIARIGEGKDTRWLVKHVSGPVVNRSSEDSPASSGTSRRDNSQRAQAQPARRTSPSRTDNVYHRISKEEYDVFGELLRDGVRLATLAIEVADEEAPEATPEERLKVAMSALVYAKQVYRRGMTVEVGTASRNEPEQLGLFMEHVRKSDKFYMGIVNGIVRYTDATDDDDVITAFGKIGIVGKRDLDADDEETWERVYKIAEEYFAVIASGVPEEEAIMYVQDRYGLESEEPLF